MKLSLLFDCGCDTEITSLACSTKDVLPGSLYFCLDGVNYDGHMFAEEAVQAGAAAIVADRELDLNVPVVVVDNTRRAMALTAAAFYGHPEKRMKMIGITGTNGKTTTSYIIKSILECCGRTAGLIGTNGIFFAGRTVAPGLTTPDPIDLFYYLKEMADANVGYVIMEVSAHALWLDKTEGIIFDVAAFTNLTEDHLDFFKDMKTYARAKERLFERGRARLAVINVDDRFGKALTQRTELPVISYGCTMPADVFGINLSMSVDGLEYVLNLLDDIAAIKFALPGRFNMYNTLCAASVCHALDVPIKSIQRGIRQVRRVEGRFNVITGTGCSIIIDFAHTEDGLRKLITAVREFARGRIITVFGCGGNRDKDKRPLMGKAATELSDLVVITSDNPRYEPPEEIVGQIAAGAVRQNHLEIVDRREAIRYAVKEAADQDIVIIAGKGAEKYQEIAGVKYDYNDEAFVYTLIDREEECIR